MIKENRFPFGLTMKVRVGAAAHPLRLVRLSPHSKQTVQIVTTGANHLRLHTRTRRVTFAMAARLAIILVLAVRGAHVGLIATFAIQINFAPPRLQQ